jgi:sulfite reductase alpha subunit-like flavoprotein
MEEGIFNAFADICATQKLDWNEVHATLKEQHRLHVETY